MKALKKVAKSFSPHPQGQMVEKYLRATFGGVTGRPETMCPRTNILGPLVP